MNRLKLIFTVLFIAMTFGVVNGQVGVRLGANLASLKVKVNFLGSSFAINTDEKLGGHFGVYYKKAINEKFSIRPNLIFTTGGGKFNDETTGESSNLNASYLGLPVDFMYTVPAGSNSFSLVGGPFLGFLLSSSSDESSDEDELSAMDFGLNLGFQFNVKSFGVGLSYGIGLANVIPEEEVTAFFSGAEANTKVISLYFTYDL